MPTKTFNANAISQDDYGLSHTASDINRAGAQIARANVDRFSSGDGIRWVAGAMGPSSGTLSLSPDVNRPEYRATGFEETVGIYTEAARGLMDGRADHLLIETVFDTRNAKASIAAVRDLEIKLGETIPMALSMTVVDMSGRNLFGQTWNFIRHANPVSVRLNCALGAEQMRTYAAALSRVADTLVYFFPNAGLPNDLGGLDEQPETTSAHLCEWAASGLFNIVGGCCGTTPAHVRAIADAV